MEPTGTQLLSRTSVFSRAWEPAHLCDGEGFGSDSPAGFDTIGALIVTNTSLEVPYYTYSIMGPQNPILMIKAPTLIQGHTSDREGPAPPA